MCVAGCLYTAPYAKIQKTSMHETCCVMLEKENIR
jgi:hypothetical protein